MGTYPEPTPWDQPYPGANSHLKKDVIKSLEDFFYIFEHEDHEKACMSRLLHLHQTMLLSRSKEIGGKVYEHAQELMQACSNYANGQGKMDTVYSYLEQFKADLRG